MRRQEARPCARQFAEMSALLRTPDCGWLSVPDPLGDPVLPPLPSDMRVVIDGHALRVLAEQTMGDVRIVREFRLRGGLPWLRYNPYADRLFFDEPGA